MKEYVDELIALGVRYAPRIVGAILVLAIGFWAAKWVSRLVTKAMLRAQVQADLTTFLKSLISVLIKSAGRIQRGGDYRYSDDFVCGSAGGGGLCRRIGIIGKLK